MSRALLNGAAAVALVAAAGGAFVGVLALRGAGPTAMSTSAAAEPTGKPIYYQDPDGKPFYSLTPREDAGRQHYRAVPAGADVSFDSEAPERLTDGSGIRAKDQILPQPDGPAGHVADAEERLDGDGLHRRL